LGKIKERECKGPLNPPKGEVFISEKKAFVFLCALAPSWQKKIVNSWLTKNNKMKKILSIIILTIGFISFGFAQQKANDKAIIQTPGVHCEYCKKRLENYVSRQPGILSVNADFKKKTTTVAWVKDRTNLEEVKAHIANAGYDADDVMAEKTTYDRFPKACQVKTTPFEQE